MSKNTKLIIYSLIYILFMIIIRYTLSHAHGFLIDHCLMIFLAIAVVLGYFHGFIFKFNFTIVFVAIFMMLFIGQMTPPSRGFIEYSFIDFYYVSAATIFMLVADIAGPIRKTHLIQKEIFLEQLEKEKNAKLFKK